MTKEDTIEVQKILRKFFNSARGDSLDIYLDKYAKAIKQHYLGKFPKEEELPSKDCYCNGEISFCSYCSRILERNKALADIRKVIGQK